MIRLLSLLVLIPSLACAAIYAYVDGTGRTFIVDRLDAVPAEYRDGLEKVDGKYDGLSAGERDRLKAEETARVKARREAQYAAQRARSKELKRKAAQLESERERLRAAQEFNERGNVKVRILGNHIHVPVVLRLDKKEVGTWLLFDTGASITVVTEKVARRLGIDVDKLQKLHAFVVGGGVVEGRRAFIHEARVGPCVREPFTINILKGSGNPRFAEGLLGMDFIRHFEYDIDFEQETIRFRPRGK